MSQQGSWQNGLSSCFSPLSTCCLATWCPCILYGKTQARRDGHPDASACNGSCMAFGALCTLANPTQAILQMLSRRSMRREYDIDSNGCNDCLISCCCVSCALVQEDKEVRAHTERSPMVEKGYTAPNGGQQMTYGQPQ